MSERVPTALPGANPAGARPALDLAAHADEERGPSAGPREDSFLLGLVAEQLLEHSETSAILRACLERISVLKDIPLCLCLSVSGREATVLEHYSSSSDAGPAHPVLRLPEPLAERLRRESPIVGEEDCAAAGLGAGGPFRFAATGALLIPFHARPVAEGVLVFADHRGPRRLEREAAFLHRVCDALVSRIDHVALLEAYRSLAADLEAKVRERTRDLAERNRELTREVEDRKRAEEALRESEEKFRIAFTTSPDAININRLEDGRYIAVNEGFTRLSGWSEADVTGRSSLELGIWDDPADRERLVALVESHGAAENLEARFRFKNGQVRDGLMSARRIRLGGETCLLSVTRDVTALKRAQAERDRLAAQFGQAQKMEAIGRLAGGVAHDFNNLLTVILSCADALKRELAEGGRGRFEDVEEIVAAGERARDLTRQLLAFARKQPVAPVPLDLAAVVRRNEKLLRRVLGEDVELRVHVDDGLWPVLCDPGQMEQVLLNLAVNARDAMPRGGTLTIEARNAEPGAAAAAGCLDGSWVRVVVSDSGTGMPAEVMAHLFEPFFTTKPLGQGTGLGLATVHGIVAQSGGHIHARSEPGMGSTFELWFPRTSGAPEPVRTGEGASRRAGEGGGETVLLIEDDARVRRVTSRILEQGGYRVIVANDGNEALARAREEARPLDLVVTDVVMPGLGGRAVADQLRELWPRTPVLFVSGYPQDFGTAEGAFGRDASCLPKPFTPVALLERVRALLDGRSGALDLGVRPG